MQTGFNVFLKSNVVFFIKKPVFVTTLAGSIVSDSLPKIIIENTFAIYSVFTSGSSAC